MDVNPMMESIKILQLNKHKPWKSCHGEKQAAGRTCLFVLRGAFDYRMTSQPTPSDVLHQEIRPY